MTIGIILAILYILTCLKFLTKRSNNKKLDIKIGKIHRILGIILLATAIVHMILVLPLIKQRPFSMYLAGMIMMACAFISMISYIFRKKLKMNWIVIHRVATLIFGLCLIFHVFIGVKSLNVYQTEVKNMDIHNIELQNISNGNYIGEYDVGYIYAKVEVMINNGKIKSVKLLEHRTERGKRAEAITKSIVKYQRIKVDTVSGATNSSKVIMKAAESAITASKIKQ